MPLPNTGSAKPPACGTRPWEGFMPTRPVGGFYAKCDRYGVRLGRAGRGRQVRLEHLARGAVAEAAPRRVVEPIGEPPQAGPPERPGLAVARQEAADAT